MKSRIKTQQATKAMMDRVDKLRVENEELETSIQLYTNELRTLKDFFVAHAGHAHGTKLNEVELAHLLRDDCEIDSSVILLLNLSQGSPPQ